MNFTKTDFKKYLICPECLWLEKKKPEEYQKGEIDEFLQKLIDDGYEVEEYVKKMFPSAVILAGSEDYLIKRTQEEIPKQGIIFQPTFKTKRNLLARVDMLRFNDEIKKWDIYEIKSSSEIKTDVMHNHIKDVAFQKLVLQESGLEIGDCYIVHLNRDYIRKGELDYVKLFVFANVNEAVENDYPEVYYHVDKALELLVQDDLHFSSCSCLYKSAGQRCDCFAHFNPQVPEYSTAHILRGKKLTELVDMDIFDPKGIPEDFKLTEPQRIKVQLQKIGKIQIDANSIQETLNQLVYPLYFLDYETILKPIPPLDGYNPNSQIVFQYSLHVLEENGEMQHFEYLAQDLESSTEALVKSLSENIGPKGNVIVWHKTFEKGRNDELAKLHPEYKNFFQDINKRIFDLKEVFQKDYLDPRAFGSASIKKILPLLVPELSYKNLAVQNGTMAMSAWEKMLKESGEEKEQTRKDMLEYCALDTMAMVKIFEVVKKL
ncbi:MAG: DUF2779 domain-containing protein [Patescibacteria group bacterium]